MKHFSLLVVSLVVTALFQGATIYAAPSSYSGTAATSPATSGSASYNDLLARIEALRALLEDIKARVPAGESATGSTNASSNASTTTLGAVIRNVAGTGTVGTKSCDVLLTLRTLSIGMQNNEVRVLQRFLVGENMLDADLITGYYGPATVAAVKRWQFKNNVTTIADPGYGMVGPKTRAAMHKKCMETPATGGSTATGTGNTASDDEPKSTPPKPKTKIAVDFAEISGDLPTKTITGAAPLEVTFSYSKANGGLYNIAIHDNLESWMYTEGVYWEKDRYINVPKGCAMGSQTYGSNCSGLNLAAVATLTKPGTSYARIWSVQPTDRRLDSGDGVYDYIKIVVIE